MRHRVWVLVAAACIASTAPARAQAPLDEESLKLAHQTLFASVKAGNLTLVQAMMHPQGLGFFRESERPVDLRLSTAASSVLPAVLTDLGQFVAVPTDTVYRVVGPVGIVLMNSLLRAPKESKQADRASRATYVYIVDGGNWKVLSWHGSDTPLKPLKK